MSERGKHGYAPGWCVHYRAATDNETCEAGVNYIDLAGGRRLWMTKVPCFSGNFENPSNPCEHFRQPTPEEIEQYEAWVLSRLDRLRLAMVGIAPWREKHKGKSIQEIVECPVCGENALSLSMSSVNGHVHGRCQTEDCVVWME